MIMQVVKTKSQLREILNGERCKGRSIGLVPTMGALHQGHISLIERCVQENAVCVCSVFVNPTQFNDKNDLIKYPRQPEKDAAMLQKAGCSLLFMPDEQEMYPEEDTRLFNFGLLEEVMEGVYRKGHFNGVAQIVSKLFDSVQPDKAYFGQKDFQQLAVVREMVRQLDMKVQIVPCPIVREKSGLAMSSRNELLSVEQKEKASLISKYLFESLTFVSKKRPAEIKEFVVNGINAEPMLRLEYFEIVDGTTLQSIHEWAESSYVVGCIAVYCGSVRLIDNIEYKKC